jgi:hypothetical protein
VNTADRVKAIVKRALVPCLAKDGYRKQGNNFRFFGDGFVRMVRVAGGWHNVNLDAGSVGSFSVELGLFFPEYLRVQGKVLRSQQPGIGDMALVVGLGPDPDSSESTPPHHPTRVRWGWFDDLAGTEPDVEAQAKALNEDWLEYGRPWMERHSSIGAARDYCVNHSLHIEALFLSLALGDTAEARCQLAACNRVWGGQWREYVNRIAAEHGVKL